MGKINLKLFKDILKERTKYSQGRVYLFLSIVAYYTTLAILTIKGSAKEANIDLDSFQIIVDALQWAMGLFAGYVFGGKGIEALKYVMGNKKDRAVEETPEEELGE